MRKTLPTIILLLLAAGCAQSSTEQSQPAAIESSAPEVSVATTESESFDSQKYLRPLDGQCELPEVESYQTVVDAAEIPFDASYGSTMGLMGGEPSEEVSELDSKLRILYWDTPLEGGVMRVRINVVDDQVGSRVLEVISDESKCTWTILPTSKT
ncbi:MAG: hypothetical protein NW224_03960 [Leptolyngbyaceae cyanobacterium bins.302]|nr:hypothetical protein [Leptolyngbyaceae cyanobacterium bins.302]